MKPAHLRYSLLLGLFVVFSVYIVNAQNAPSKGPKAQKVPIRIVYAKAYKKWLTEDVVYIMSDEEREDFKSLTTDHDHDDFIEKFWESRNPNPGAKENKFKEEHYRRIGYTNEHFSAAVPGWKTDRGRIFIMYGAPDAIDRHFSDAGSEGVRRGSDDVAIPYDWELWHYSYIEGIGEDVSFKFVDVCGCGDYRIPVEKEEPQK